MSRERRRGCPICSTTSPRSANIFVPPPARLPVATSSAPSQTQFVLACTYEANSPPIGTARIAPVTQMMHLPYLIILDDHLRSMQKMGQHARSWLPPLGRSAQTGSPLLVTYPGEVLSCGDAGTMICSTALFGTVTLPILTPLPAPFNSGWLVRRNAPLGFDFSHTNTSLGFNPHEPFQRYLLGPLDD